MAKQTTMTAAEAQAQLAELMTGKHSHRLHRRTYGNVAAISTAKMNSINDTNTHQLDCGAIRVVKAFALYNKDQKNGTNEFGAFEAKNAEHLENFDGVKVGHRKKGGNVVMLSVQEAERRTDADKAKLRQFCSRRRCKYGPKCRRFIQGVQCAFDHTADLHGAASADLHGAASAAPTSLSVDTSVPSSLSPDKFFAKYLKISDPSVLEQFDSEFDTVTDFLKELSVTQDEAAWFSPFTEDFTPRAITMLKRRMANARKTLA